MSDQLEFSDLLGSGRAAVYRGSHDLHVALKHAAAKDVKQCPLSRGEIADRISMLVGARITVAQIDAILAESHKNRMPAEWVPAWVQVTGSTRILELLCASANLHLAGEVEHDLADLARAQLQHEKLTNKIEALRKRLAEMV
jgi:hypothetical protein